MCTATWAFRGGPGAWSLELGFNRDEHRSRPRAQAPRLRRPPAGGRPFLAPRDPLGGGTWLAVNDAGICLALLNRYGSGAQVPVAGPVSAQRPAAASVGISRGQVVWRLAALSSPEAIAAALEPLVADEAPRPFQLLLLRGGSARLAMTWQWDGRSLFATDLRRELPFLSSSAYRGAEVIAGRRERYAAAEAGIVGPEARRAFHRGHEPERGAWSVCMHRPEARSVSYCQLRLAEGFVGLRYAAGAPCRAALGPELRLELAR